MERLKYITDILPEPSEKELARRIRTAEMFFVESNKDNYTRPEVLFIATLDYYIDYFGKAKNMVLQDRFSVAFEPQDKESTKLFITDFPIIPNEKRI